MLTLLLCWQRVVFWFMKLVWRECSKKITANYKESWGTTKTVSNKSYSFINKGAVIGKYLRWTHAISQRCQEISAHWAKRRVMQPVCTPWICLHANCKVNHSLSIRCICRVVSWDVQYRDRKITMLLKNRPYRRKSQRILASVWNRSSPNLTDNTYLH